MSITFKEFVTQTLPEIKELYPWDIEELIESSPHLLLVDIREKEEFDALHIKPSILAPRGILETCCDWGYAETIPALASARKQPVIVICRSGNRSVLAAKTLQEMGYEDVASMKTGVKGWNDSDYPLYDRHDNPVDPDRADEILNPPIKPEQLGQAGSGTTAINN